MEERYDYKIGIVITYKERGLPMDIRKSKENFKDKKLRCFNCDLYGYMVKNCQKLKKEKCQDHKKWTWLILFFFLIFILFLIFFLFFYF